MAANGERVKRGLFRGAREQIRQADIRREQQAAQGFISSDAIQRATETYQLALEQATAAAQNGATAEQLRPFKQLAAAAAVEVGEVTNTGILAARNRGLRVSARPITQQDVQRKIDAFDAAISAAVPNPQATGQREGEQERARLASLLGREPTEQELAQAADVAPEGGPFEGTGMRQQSANVVLELSNKFRRGEELTPEEKDRYAFAYAELSAPRMVGSASTGFEFIAQKPDPRFPAPESLGATSVPGTGQLANPNATTIPAKRSPEQAGRLALMQSGLRTARNVRQNIVRPDGSVNRQLMTTMIFNAPGSEGRTLRNDMEQAVAAKLRIETGAAATPAEIQNMLDRFMPSNLDGDETVANKLTEMVTFFEEALSNTDPELFERLKGRNPDIPEPPETEAESKFLRFDPDTGNPIFERPDGSRFMVTP